MEIRAFNKEDFSLVREIYQQGIDTGKATFQEKAKNWQEWDSSLIPNTRLVATVNGDVVGWAGLSYLSNRKTYSGVAEVSIYVASQHQGQGIGKNLLSALISKSEELGFWTLQAAIFPENEGSIALHSTQGFRQVGLRERLGKMHGIWRDVVLMERRSNKVGL